jgi:hypothetical protein
MPKSQTPTQLYSKTVANNKFPFLMNQIDYHLKTPIDTSLWKRVMDYWQGEAKHFTQSFSDSQYCITLTGNERETRIVIEVNSKENTQACTGCSTMLAQGFLCLICGQCSECGCMHD